MWARKCFLVAMQMSQPLSHETTLWPAAQASALELKHTCRRSARVAPTAARHLGDGSLTIRVTKGKKNIGSQASSSSAGNFPITTCMAQTLYTCKAPFAKVCEALPHVHGRSASGMMMLKVARRQVHISFNFHEWCTAYECRTCPSAWAVKL